MVNLIQIFWPLPYYHPCSEINPWLKKQIKNWPSNGGGVGRNELGEELGIMK
jgi:hypothetical protein